MLYKSLRRRDHIGGDALRTLQIVYKAVRTLIDALMVVSALEGLTACSNSGMNESGRTRDVTAGVDTSKRMVTASRIFAGPNQYPPMEFAAYGILAFRSRPSSHDRDRYMMFCEAYATILPQASELAVHRARQMVTVWPINTDDNSNLINRLEEYQVKDICRIAVDNYGLVIAQQALKDAERAPGVNTIGNGPFLIAWSPSTDKGKQGVPVLVSDLSNVTTYEQAHKMFLDWSRDIERDPTLWSNGWNIERLRRAIQQWVDKYGPMSLAVFGGKG